jgi:hypothetical protein
LDEVVFVSHFSHTGLNVIFELDTVQFWHLHDSCERLFKELSNIPKGVVLLDPEKL